MSFLVYPTEEQAKERTRQSWVQVLGRGKNPIDVTEFLWAWRVGRDGKTVLTIDSRSDLLTPQEADLSVEVLPVDWDSAEEVG
jgi:hypothetical protein